MINRKNSTNFDKESEVNDMTIILGITTVICAIGCLTCYLGSAGLLLYIKKNGYKLPDKQEIYECTRSAAKKIFKL